MLKRASSKNLAGDTKNSMSRKLRVGSKLHVYVQLNVGLVRVASRCDLIND